MTVETAMGIVTNRVESVFRRVASRIDALKPVSRYFSSGKEFPFLSFIKTQLTEPGIEPANEEVVAVGFTNMPVSTTDSTIISTHFR
jgi:hypothetical protein